MKFLSDLRFKFMVWRVQRLIRLAEKHASSRSWRRRYKAVAMARKAQRLVMR